MRPNWEVPELKNNHHLNGFFLSVPVIQWPADAATLRAGVAAIQRGRARAAYPAAAAAAAAAFARHPTPLAGE